MYATRLFYILVLFLHSFQSCNCGRCLDFNNGHHVTVSKDTNISFTVSIPKDCQPDSVIVGILSNSTDLPRMYCQLPITHGTCPTKINHEQWCSCSEENEQLMVNISKTVQQSEKLKVTAEFGRKPKESGVVKIHVKEPEPEPEPEDEEEADSEAEGTEAEEEEETDFIPGLTISIAVFVPTMIIFATVVVICWKRKQRQAALAPRVVFRQSQRSVRVELSTPQPTAHIASSADNYSEVKDNLPSGEHSARNRAGDDGYSDVYLCRHPGHNMVPSIPSRGPVPVPDYEEYDMGGNRQELYQPVEVIQERKRKRSQNQHVQ